MRQPFFDLPPPNEVGHRRGALRPFSIALFPNCAGPFPSTRLSRGDTSLPWDSGRSYAFRGLPTQSRSEVFLLPPLALRPDLPISLVGRDSHDSYGGSVTICLAAGR
jgi:hypothetical protein